MSLLSKRFALYSIATMKCPHCHHGSLFSDRNPYHLSKLGRMPEHCPVCGQAFYPEPGFYFGAMYVSYMMSVCLSVVNILLIWWIFGLNIYNMLIGNAVLLILLLPVLYRYARTFWIHIAVRFSPEEYAQALKR